MSTQVQLRRGTTAEHATFTGAVGEATVDTTKDTLVVHDGATAGGIPLALESHAHAATYQPLDADLTALAASAATAGLVERTGAATYTTRLLGVTNATDVPTRADADTRYAAASHGHTEVDITLAGTGVVVGATTPGAAAELSASAVLDFIGSTRGAVIYRGAAGWSILAPGTSTHVLTSNGTGADPSYQAAGGGGTPAGASGTVQYNNAGAFAGASSMEIDASGNPVLTASTPTTPAAGDVSLYALDLAGRTVPAFVGSSGAAMALQSHIGQSRRMEWVAQNGISAVAAYGGAATTAGTATLRSIAAGSFFSWARRVSFVSAAAAGSSAGVRHAQYSYGLGDAAGAGGFTLVARFGIADAAAVANARMFVGMYATTSAIGNVEPSSLTSIVGLGCDAGVTNLYIMHNDAAGAATTVDLGANFPTNTQSVDVYELALYCAPNGSTVGYRVTRLNTGHVASGTISTNLPANTVQLTPHLWRNNGATALAVDLAFMGLYVETDN